MGYAMAESAIESGHEVVLISGPVSLPAPRGAHLVSISSSDELHDAVREHLPNCDILVMCAAVADYKPAHVSAQKIKKSGEPVALELVPTPDILASLPAERAYRVVGFAAETENVEENARKKLRAKQCDLIVANDVSDAKIGMESDENEVTIFFKNGEKRKIPRASKKNIARALTKIFENV